VLWTCVCGVYDVSAILDKTWADILGDLCYTCRLPGQTCCRWHKLLSVKIHFNR